MREHDHRKPEAAKTAGDLFLGGCSAEDLQDAELELFMSYAEVNRICRATGGYTLPRLNSNLYLQGQRFRRISHLDKYTRLRALHLENNLISEIEGLSHMTTLRVLYLDRNMLTHVGGLEGCGALDTLHVTSNQLQRLDCLPPSLATFNAAGNNLCTEHALAPLKACEALTVLDLSDNHIGPALLPFFQHMPTLRVLYLQGNPITKLPTYRRHLVSSLTGLTYLDDQPVHDIERAACQAWAAASERGERVEDANAAYFAARTAYRKAQQAAERQRMESFRHERAERALLRSTGAAAAAEAAEWRTDELVTTTAVRFQAAPTLPTASRQQLDALSAITLSAHDTSGAGVYTRVECIVCQEGYAAGERVLTLPCAHLFHAACISPWLLQFSCICPICRGSLSPTTAGPPPTAIATHQSSPAAAVAATMPRPSLAAVQCVAAVQCDGAAAAASVSNRMRLRGSASNRNELFFGPVDELPQGPSIVAPSSQPPAADGTHGVSNTEQVQQLLVRAFRKHKVYGKRSTEVGRFVGETHEGVVTAKSALRPSWKLLESSRMTRVPTTRSIPVAQGPAPCTVAYDTQQCDQVLEELVAHVVALGQRGVSMLRGGWEGGGAGDSSSPAEAPLEPPSANDDVEEEEEEDEPSWHTVRIARQLWWQHTQGDRELAGAPSWEGEHVLAEGVPPLVETVDGKGDDGPHAHARPEEVESEEGSARGDEGASSCDTPEDALAKHAAENEGEEERVERDTLNLRVATALDEEDEDAWMWEAIPVTMMPYA